ncbi:hypothetical protein ABIE69_001986 [Rhodobacteraceae bacterium MBR-64]|jgi:hypothetical protein
MPTLFDCQLDLVVRLLIARITAHDASLAIHKLIVAGRRRDGPASFKAGKRPPAGRVHYRNHVRGSPL